MSETPNPTQEEERAVHVQQMLKDIEQKNQQMRTEWFKTMAIVIGSTAALFGTIGAWFGYTLRGH